MTDTTWATSLASTDNVSASRVALNDNFAGARRRTPVTITSADSPYTAGDQDLIACDCSSGAITINLPAGTVGDGYSVVKVDSSSNVVTIDGDGSDTINGATTRELSTQWAAVSIAQYADGEWVEA